MVNYSMPDSPYAVPVSDAHALRPASQAELEGLQERIARLEAREAEAPWWRSARTVTLLATFLAAFVPLTSALQTWLKGRSDLALASEQQRHAMRMDYLRTALDPASPQLERQSRLRLLVAILAADDPARAWASTELEDVDRAVVTLQRELASAETGLNDVSQAEQLARDKLTALESSGPVAEPTPASERPREVQKVKRELEQIGVQKSSLTERIERAHRELAGEQAPKADWRGD
jgi:hypothetical protein